MYNNGLQDNELQQLHKYFKLNMNMFLQDILQSDMFKVIDKTDFYDIIPLFYCDRIITDGDAFIHGTYSITCKKNYKQIFMFISENNLEFDKMYTIKKYDDSNYYLIFVYNLISLEPCRNHIFNVEYDNLGTKQYLTDDLGYCLFEADEDEFKVVL